jgi:hypothetical protein
MDTDPVTSQEFQAHVQSEREVVVQIVQEGRDRQSENQKHFDDMGAQLQNVFGTLKNIENKLEPMAINYQAANKLGKWVMVILLAISLITGSLWAIISSVHTFKQ